MPLYDALKGLYCLRETIGSGGFGKVKKGVHILTGETVAIKIMNKRKLGAEVPRVQTEIEAMQQLVHQNICQLYQVIETNEDFFLILEYCPNGELFDYIVMRNHLDEDQARFFFTQILGAVAYIHQCGYAHRDLKPENLLLDDKGNLKLIDFGLCVKPAGGMDAHVSTCCGSPAYAAPELIAGKLYLGREADIWSLGVLLYALLCGFLPFDDSNAALLYRKIQLGKYLMPTWLSSGSCDLVGRMLQTDPKVRIKMEDLIRHPWVTNGSSRPLLWHSSIKSDVLDEDCLRVLRRHYKKSVEEMRSIILRSRHNYMTATYKLLLLKKLQGKQAMLNVDQWNYSVPIDISAKVERVELVDCKKQHFESTKIGAVVATSKAAQRRQENKENVKSSASETSKNETLFVEEKVNGNVKCGAADTRDFAELHVISKKIHINVLPVDLISEQPSLTKKTSKQKSKVDLPEKKVKWNIPKMPQTSCMRGCGLNTDDENDGFQFPDRFKCCNSEKLALDDDLFVFTDYRKRKVELNSLEEKERKITKTVIPRDPEAIYDNVLNLGLSPRTSDVLRKSRRRGNDKLDAGTNEERQKYMSPGQKLTRWKNNQRRKAPEMRFMSPECRKMRKSHNDWSSPQTSAGGKRSNKSKEIKTDGTFQLPLSSVKTCRRVLDWVNASSESNVTDDETDTKTSACRKLEFGSTSTDSGNPDKNSVKTFPSSEFKKHEVSSGASSSLLRKSLKSSTQNDVDSSLHRNTVDCGKVLPANDFSCIRNSMGSPWMSVESNLHDAQRIQTAYVTSASVETELDRMASSQRNDKKLSIMENFERGMDRLLGIFTPKKFNFQLEPRRIKLSHNVKLISEQEAHLTIQKLKEALDKKRIQYKEKGFTLKCSVLDRCHQTALSLSLEVVRIQKATLGIRHKRLTGDVWYYKRLCESIFKLAKL